MSVSHEQRAVDFAHEMLSERLRAYRTTVAEDRQVLSDPRKLAGDARVRTIVTYRRDEKEILTRHQLALSTYRASLPDADASSHEEL